MTGYDTENRLNRVPSLTKDPGTFSFAKEGEP